MFYGIELCKMLHLTINTVGYVLAMLNARMAA